MSLGSYAKLIGAGLIAAVLGLGLWWARHSGYMAGVASQQQMIADRTRERDLARAQVAADADTLAEINAASAKAKADAAAQRQQAQAAMAEADKAKAAKAKAEADFMARLKAATQRPECAVLKEVLCDSVKDY